MRTWALAKLAILAYPYDGNRYSVLEYALDRSFIRSRLKNEPLIEELVAEGPGTFDLSSYSYEDLEDLHVTCLFRADYGSTFPLTYGVDKAKMIREVQKNHPQRPSDEDSNSEGSGWGWIGSQGHSQRGRKRSLSIFDGGEPSPTGP